MQTQTVTSNTVVKTNSLMKPKEKLMMETELDLIRFKEIKNQLAILEAEKNQLQTKLINGWFKKHATFENENGVKLASRIIKNFVQFNNAEFEKTHPALYEQFKTREVTQDYILPTKFL